MTRMKLHRRRLVLPAVAAVATLALSACGGGGSKSSTTSSQAAASNTTSAGSTSGSSTAGVPTGAPEGVKSYAGLGRNHTTDDVKYDQNPPVGGDHDPVWQPCKFYDQPIRTQRGVHSMEHGAVWITYSPDLPADQVAILKLLAKGQTHVLVSPYAGLPSPVVASAWGEQLVLPAATDGRLVQFIKFFQEGPQTPEAGAPC